jgi:hypothetical protein
MKNLLAIGITGTLMYLGFKAFGLNRFNVYSVVRTLNPRITKITLTGLSLATDISIDNPTNTSLKVSKPVVTITTGGKYAASSVPSTETFTIAPGLLDHSLTIKIVDLSGRIIATNTIYAGQTIGFFETDVLYNGAYFLEISNGKALIRKRILIQH